MTSIFLAERWSRVGSTVSALNCQLASLAAQNRQKTICCLVLNATKEEEIDADDCGVKLILPCLNEDVFERYKDDQPTLDWILSPETFFTTLMEFQNVEFIIEHIQPTTKLLNASVFRKRCFKDAGIVLINHGSPSVDLREKHLKFAEAAAVVFSVGPTVFEEYKTLYQLTKTQIKHEVYIPRPESTFFDLYDDKMSKTSAIKQILTVVTDKNVESTRFEDLSGAVGQVATLFKRMCAKIPKWLVRTSSAADLNDTKNFLNDHLNCKYIEPNIYIPYGSQDDIYRDLQQSNVLVIPPDEPFRMEALWAIAAGLPVLIPKRTAMAEFLKKYFGESAEYFLYEPSVDDLSDQISKMLNGTETVGVTRKLKNAYRSHTEISGSHENFKACFDKRQQPYPQPASVTATLSPPHRHSTDDGICSIEDAYSQQSLSPQPVSPDSPVFPHKALTSQVQRVPVIERKRPLMPTILCEADLEIVEKKMKMETVHLIERERQQLELQKEKDQQQLELQKEKDQQQLELQKEKDQQQLELQKEKDQQQLELQKEKDQQQLELQKEKDQQKFNKENKEILRAEIKKLYELEKKKIMARNSPDLVKELDEAYDKFKARLDDISDGSLQFMLSFLSEEDIDYFWQKHKAADVEEVLSGILITPKMRSLAEEAGFTARIRLKIDKKEYEQVKEILHEMEAVYVAEVKTWVKTVIYDKWEEYVLNQLEENQAKFLIEQSRFHPIVNELRFDTFFFPSLLLYWCENCYNLPSTLTEATEFAIGNHVEKYCKEHHIEIEHVADVVRERLCEFGKQALYDFAQTQIFRLQLNDSYEKDYLFGLLKIVNGSEGIFLSRYMYFYAVAEFLRKQRSFSKLKELDMIAKAMPVTLQYLVGIIKEEPTHFFEVITNCIIKTYPIVYGQLALLGCCVLESKYQEKFIQVIHYFVTQQILDLSTIDFDSVSLRSVNAVAFVIKNTALIKSINLVTEKEKPFLSKAFKNLLDVYVDRLAHSINFQIKNSVELFVLTKVIKQFEVFKALDHNSVILYSERLASVAIEAIDYPFVHEDRTVTLVRALASVQTLKFVHLTGFNENFIAVFFQVMIMHNLILRLRTLDLSGNNLNNTFSNLLLNALKCLPFLQQVEVRNNKLGGIGCVALLPISREIKVLLESNTITECLKMTLENEEFVKQVGDPNLRHKKLQTLGDVRNVVSKLKNVKELDGKNFAHRNVTLLCESLALYNSLIHLTLRECGITQDLAKLIADSFEYFQALKRLDLSSNRIGDDGINYIGRKMHVLNDLEYANFRKTHISIPGICELMVNVKVKQHKLINVAHNIQNLAYVLPHVKDQLKHYSVDLKLDADILTLDNLAFLGDFNIARYSLLVKKGWAYDDFVNLCKGLAILSCFTSIDVGYKIGDIGTSNISLAISKMANLKRLCLTRNDVGDMGAKCLGEAIANLFEIEELDLSGNNIGYTGAESLSEGLKNLTNLRDLNLSQNKIRELGVKKLCKALKKTSWIEKINLSDNNIGDIGVKALSEVVKNMTELMHVDLSYNNIGDSGVQSLNIGLNIAKSGSLGFENVAEFEYLNLSHNCIGALGAQHLSNGIEYMPEVTHLDLSHNFIGDVGLKRFCKILKTMTVLEYINLGKNGISDRGAEYFSKVVGAMTNLVHLNLNNNNIGDVGAKLIGRVIANNDWIEHLDLSHNSIGDSGAIGLSEGIANMTFLSHLDLSYNSIGDLGVQSLSVGLRKAKSPNEGYENVDDLHYLNLSHNIIGGIGAKCLSEEIQNFSELNYLDLSYNNIDHVGAKALTHMAQHMCEPMCLNLSHNKVSYYGTDSL